MGRAMFRRHRNGFVVNLHIARQFSAEPFQSRLRLWLPNNEFCTPCQSHDLCDTFPAALSIGLGPDNNDFFIWIGSGL